jgi:hypothetical protein
MRKEFKHLSNLYENKTGIIFKILDWHYAVKLFLRPPQTPLSYKPEVC